MNNNKVMENTKNHITASKRITKSDSLINTENVEKIEFQQFRSLIFSKEIKETKFNEHLKSTFEGLYYIKNSLNQLNEIILKKKEVKLPMINSKNFIFSLFLLLL